MATNEKGWRKPVDLTTTEYKQLKKNGMTDAQIVGLTGVSKTTFQQWKKENGVADIRLKAKELMNPVTSRGEKKYKEMVIRVKELRTAYWNNVAIADELGVSEKVITTIIKRHYPEERRKEKTVYTKDQKERAEKSGVTMWAVKCRMEKGMTFNEALDIPNKRKRFFTKGQSEVIKKSGWHRKTIYSRMKNGMTFDEAISTPLKKIVKKGRKNRK